MSSILRKFVAIILVTIIIPVLLLSAYSLSFFQNILIENARESNLRLLSGLGANLDTITDDMVTAVKFISLDANVLEIMNSSEQDGFVSVEKSIAIEKMMLNLRIIYLNHYFQINVLNTRGEFVSGWSSQLAGTGVEYIDNNWFHDAIADPGVNVWVAPYIIKDPYNLSAAPLEQIMVVTAVANFSINKVLGVVTLSMPKEQFAKMVFTRKSYMEKLNDATFVVDPTGDIILASHEQSGIETLNDVGIQATSLDPGDSSFFEIDGQEYLVNCVGTKNIGWKIVQLVPYDDIVKGTRTLLGRIIIAYFILFSIVILMVIAFSNSLTKPLRFLVGHMKKVEEGNWLIRAKNRRHSADEIAVLDDAFNRMVDKQRELVDRITEEERKIQETQRKENELRLDMLMAQINPHFLFNTLNAIKWSALMSGADNVALMIAHLGNLLEMSINRKGDTTTLEEEIKNVESYVFIQIVRYGSGVEVVYRIDDQVKDDIVPKLILQPLVENAFMHAFADQDSGRIVITARETGKVMEITVADNGRGLEVKDINELLNKGNGSDRKYKFSGIGINNVNDRIKLLYGEAYGLAFQSRIGEGTTVVVRLPIRKLGDMHDQSIDC